MAFDGSPEGDFRNEHDFEAARKRLIELQRGAVRNELQFGLFGEEIAVDLFAGAGGASLGLKQALGRDPAICINHDPAAIACHKLNTPGAEHYVTDVFDVDPRTAVRGRPVGVLWMSPTCIFFSTAKGGAPLDAKEARKVRGLAWIGVKWAREVRPRIILCENVEPFKGWCRIGKDGKADKSRIDKQGYGEYFKKWVGQLRALGYSVEWRVISAADFGAPTIRKRIFIIARCDGLPIVWPKPTHAPASVTQHGVVSAWAKGHGLTSEDLKNLQPHRTTAECIDWSLRSVSIFASKAEAKKLKVKRPLKDPTLARIAKGVVRFVLASERPYIVNKGQAPFLATLNHQGDESRAQRLDEPKHTICAARDAVGLVIPHVTRFRTGSVGSPVDEPLNTITSGQGSIRPAGHAHAMGLVEAQIKCAAAMIQTGYGERDGQEPRVLDLGKPLGTIMAGGVKHALVEAGVRRVAASGVVVAIDNQSSGDGCAYDVNEPLGTIVKENRHALAEAAFIVQQNLGAVGRPADEPVATITKTGSQQQLVTAHMTSFYGSNQGSTQGDLEQPLGTITAGGFHQALVTTELSSDDLAGARRVARFLKRYYKPGKKDPVLTVDAANGVVSVNGLSFQVVDIALRMMAVLELKRCQGFPDSYRLDPECEYRTSKGTKFGPLPQSEQVAKIGNSVCPQVARALAEANLYHERIERLTVPKRARSTSSGKARGATRMAA